VRAEGRDETEVADIGWDEVKVPPKIILKKDENPIDRRARAAKIFGNQ
jgi:hypothetical protein